MGPSYAILFVRFSEHQIFSPYNGSSESLKTLDLSTKFIFQIGAPRLHSINERFAFN